MVVFLRFKAQSVRLQDGLSQLPEHKLSQKKFSFIESNLCYWQRYQNYYIIPSPMWKCHWWKEDPPTKHEINWLQFFLFEWKLFSSDIIKWQQEVHTLSNNWLLKLYCGFISLVLKLSISNYGWLYC